MPPRKKAPAPDKPKFPEATSEYKEYSGFRPGTSDSPPMHGLIPVPEGAANCLAGITFVATGTMRSLQRDELQTLISKYGGRLTSAISGKTDVLIRGVVEVGPKKIQEAKTRGIQVTDEDGLFEFIAKTNPDWKPPEEAKPKEDEAPKEASNTPQSKSTLWTDKYAPQSLDEFIGNQRAIKSIGQCLQSFPDKQNKPMLLMGQHGIGKTTAAILSAKHYKYNYVHLNATNKLSAKLMKGKYKGQIKNKSLQNDLSLSKTLYIFDEIEGSDISVTELLKITKKLKQPVIIIGTDLTDSKYTTLIKSANTINFSPLLEDQIIPHLKKIASRESLHITPQGLKRIARQSHGDLRNSIMNLQFCTRMDDDYETGSKIVTYADCQAATLKLFHHDTDFATRMELYYTNSQLMPYYVYGNLPFEDYKNDAIALDYISLGDVVKKTMNETQDYKLMPVVSALACAGPSLAYKNGKNVFSAKFPNIMRSNEDKNKNILTSIHSTALRCFPVSTNEFVTQVAHLIMSKVKSLSTRKNLTSIINYFDQLELSFQEYLGIEKLLDIGNYGFTLDDAGKKKLRKIYRKRHGDSTDLASDGVIKFTREDYKVKERPSTKDLLSLRNSLLERKKIVLTTTKKRN